MATQLRPADDHASTALTRFRSILFPVRDDVLARETPDYFHDVNLDQVVEWITSRWQEYDLAPFFQTPMRDLDAIAYRQEIMRELERESVMQAFMAYAERMRTMRRRLPHEAKSHLYRYEKERWFLAAVEVYCEANERLRDDLQRLDLDSRGLRAFRDYLTGYAGSPKFTSLAAHTRRMKDDLSAIRYAMLIDGGSVTVRRYDGENDYSAVVEKTFEKFRRAAAKDYRAKFAETGGLNHVEAEVLQRVARLFPDAFTALEQYYAEHAAFMDETIVRFDREIHFYIAYLTYIAEFRSVGLNFNHQRDLRLDHRQRRALPEQESDDATLPFGPSRRLRDVPHGAGLAR